MGSVKKLLGGDLSDVEQPHFHAVTEHWGFHSSSDFVTDTHKWFGIDKQSTRGQHGGVGAFVINSLAPFTQIMSELSNENIMWLQVTTEDKPFFVAVIYAPPKNNNLLRDILTKTQEAHSLLSDIGDVLYMGDFNCRMGKKTRDKSIDKERANLLTEFLSSTKNAILTSDQKEHWTCYTHNGQSVNDIFCVNKKLQHQCHNYYVHKKHSFGSDHVLLSFDWNRKLTTPPRSMWTTSFLTKIDWGNETVRSTYQSQLQTSLQKWKSNLGALNSERSVEKATSTLVNTIQNTLNHFRKKRMFSSNKNNSSSEHKRDAQGLNALIKQRDDLVAQLSEHNPPKKKANLTSLITQTQSQITELTIKHKNNEMKLVWTKILELKGQNNTKDYWSLIKKLRKTQQTQLPNVMKDSDGLEKGGTTDILDIFAKHYHNVSAGKDSEATHFDSFISDKNDTGKTQSIRKCITETFRKEVAPSFSSFDNNPTEATNMIIDFEEVVRAVKNFRPGKASGLSNIPMEALQHGGDLLLRCLHLIFDSWWKQGYTLSCMQSATIVPIFKKKDMTLPENYRPISLLNSIFKVYEKILEKRLRHLVEERNILPNFQMGAIKNSGTTEALFQLLSTIHHNENNDKPVFLTFLDLSKAYDRVWRKGLWTKLWELGIRGGLLRALYSTYTTARFQVKIGDLKSKTTPIENGLRQGSVLSPLLFVLLFSEVTDHLDSNLGVQSPLGDFFHTQLFVDDTALLTYCEEDIQRQINLFNDFAAIWGSVLNMNKTNIISTKKIKNSNDWLTDMGMTSCVKTVARYLGVWISLKNSTWNQHYNIIISKARHAFFEIYAKGLKTECVTTEEAVSLFNKLVVPILNYGAEVLTPSTGAIVKVNNFLGFCAKLMLGIPLSTPNSSALWEANIVDFGLSSENAKLRFHRKLLLHNQTLGKYYRKDNYLYDLNRIILQKWFPSSHLKDVDYTKQPQMLSKYKWKLVLSSGLLDMRTKLMQQSNPLFLSIKPFHEIMPHLFKLPVKGRTLLMALRHGTLETNRCPSCPFALSYSPATHYLLHCKSPSIKQGIDYLSVLLNVACGSPTGMSSSDRLKHLLGRPLDEEWDLDGVSLLKRVTTHLSDSVPTSEFDSDDLFGRWGV